MKLYVLSDGRKIGMLESSLDGRVSFVYDQGWLADPTSFPLSLSIPKSASGYGGGTVSNWLWNLLPENPLTLDRIAKDTSKEGWTHVSLKNPLALLGKIGEDCAGAIQFVREDRLDRVSEGNIAWLSDADIAARLKELRQDRASTGRKKEDTGQFSLAGAQTKTAYHLKDGKWGLPSGSTPTTHIFKPPIPGLKGQVENEHFCLQLARNLGMRAVVSNVMVFEGERAVVVERYDRIKLPNGTVRRIHQEDMCQALRLPPDRKYQAQKGPSSYDIITKVLATSSNVSADCANFVRSMAFNYIVVGTDAHAKNYSILYGRTGAYRLAPLYDVNSFIPYAASIEQSKLAMSLGGHAIVGGIQPRHWRIQAKRCGFNEDSWVAEVRDMMARAPDNASDVLKTCRQNAITHPILDALADAIAVRCQKLSIIYGVEPRPRTEPESEQSSSPWEP